MKNKAILVLLTVLLYFLNNSFNSLSVSYMSELYKESIATYPNELTSHFPKEIAKRGFSFGGPTPKAYYALNYSGFDLFMNYNDDKEKEKYLKEIKDKFIDTTIIQENKVLFLTTIRNYCDSIESDYIVYPYPDIQDYVKILSEEQGEKIHYSPELKYYTYYLIEKKDTIIYEEQKTNHCPILEKELKHGYSRGVMVNEKDKILFYWLYFW